MKIVSLASILIGFLLGFFMPHEALQVKYVSQEEILSLEQTRMGLISDPTQKNMFFGKPKEAAEMIEEYVETRKRKNKIIVMSACQLYGDNVKSISKDAYEYVIKSLGSANE